MKILLRNLAKKLLRLAGRMSLHGQAPAIPLTMAHRVAYFIAGGIGDGIMAFPAVQALHRVLPGAELAIFVPPDKCEILQCIFEGYVIKPLTAAQLFSLIFPASKSRYDIAFTNTIAAFWVRIELAAARCSAKSFGFRYPDEKPEDRGYTASQALVDTMHDIDQNLSLVSTLLEFPVSESDRTFPAVAARRPLGNAPSVIIHAGAERGYEYKRWPIERFRVIIRKLIDDSCSVTVLAGPSEIAIGDAFAGMPVNVLVEPDARTLLSAFKNADLFIGNDSGPAHIAAFLGVPGITLIGPVNPVRTAPRGEHSRILYSKETCSPCHFSNQRCTNNRCMQSITIDQVMHSIDDLLQRT
jgi:ADP-heptose:LPS heptosyltransferase